MLRRSRAGSCVRGRVGALAHCLAPIVLSAVILSPAAASSIETSGYSVDGGRGLIDVRSASLQTRGVLGLTLSGRYYESPDLAGAVGAEEGQYGTLHIAASYGLTNWLELSLDTPVRAARWAGVDGGSDATGLSNPIVGVKLGLLTGRSSLKLSFEGRVGVPLTREMTVTDTAGSEILLTGGEDMDAEAILLASVDLRPRFPLLLHANVGWAFNRSEGRGHRFYPDHYAALSDGSDQLENDALILRGAIEFPGRTVDLFTEFRGDISQNRDGIALKENPLMVAPGVRVRFDGWALTAALAVGISGDDLSTPGFDPHDSYPDWEATISISHSRPIASVDTDHDGIPDYRDVCPELPEDFDGFEDEDGCPDRDNDNDGIPDGFDLAPNMSEDFDGFEDEDGLPDLDNDGDGIIDERDMCPDEREDFDGFEDEDGCPDL